MRASSSFLFVCIVLLGGWGVAYGQPVTVSAPMVFGAEVQGFTSHFILTGPITFSQSRLTINLIYYDVSNPLMPVPTLTLRGPITCPGGSPVEITAQLYVANVLMGPLVGTRVAMTPFLRVESSNMSGCVIVIQTPALLSPPLGNNTQCIAQPIPVDTATAEVIFDLGTCVSLLLARPRG